MLRDAAKHRITFVFAAAALAGCAQSGVVAQSADPAMGTTDSMSLPLAYDGIERVQVLCLVQADGAVAAAEDRDRLCATVVRIARQGTAIPVDAIALGDSQIVVPKRINLLVHAALTGQGATRQAAIAMRPYRADVAGSEILFGAMPRIAPFADDDALDAAVAAALDELLPWRGSTGGPRRIN